MKPTLSRNVHFAVVLAAALLLTTIARAAVTLTDIGATAPTPGANDISQLINSFPLGPGGTVPGINYYWDNPYPGQTFTTLSNPQGYTMTSLAIRTGGNGGGGNTGGQLASQSFTLNIYQLSGANATLLNNFTATGQLIAEGDWLQWTGLGVTLSPNSTYVFGFGRSPGSPGDWELISTATNLPYAGGQACIVPSGGGTVSYSSSSSNYDMTFDIGLSLPAAPIPNAPTENPTYANLGILAGSNVTLTATAAGSTPIFYQWQTDGGSGGTPTNIPGATGASLAVNTAGWAPGTYQYDFVASNSLGSVISPTAPITIVTVFMEDTGTNTPTPGPLDISQLLNTSQNDDGFNYYTDDGAGHGAWTGQTFTTGTNVNGYVMMSLAWKSAGNGSGFPTVQLYDLYLYSISGNSASLITSYQAYGGGAENDWFKWVGINVPLAANTTYGYAFGHDTTASGWEHIGDQGGNPYPGGQMFTIATPTGGTVTYGNSGNSDATFDIGLILAQAPSANPPTFTPNVNPIYANTLVTLQEAAVGPPPLHYQWLADNGTGTLSPVGGATGTNLVVDTTGFNGNYEYAVIVTNAFGASTSAVVTLALVPASAPVLTVDTTPSNVLAYATENVTFNAAFVGTLPITNQWEANTGSGYVNITHATNATLTVSNLQAANVGSYVLAASNSLGAATSTPVTVALLPPPPAPAAGSFGAALLADNPLAYWRLSETNDPTTNYLAAYDATGDGYFGIYGAGVLNGGSSPATAGPQSPAFPGFEANNNGIEVLNGQANGEIALPALNLNTNSVTITAWIQPFGTEGTFWGILMNRNGGDAAGLGFGGNLDNTGMAELGYTWNTNSSATWGFHSGLFPPTAVWSFVALTITPSNATLNLCYVNGGATNVLVAVNPIAHAPEAFSGGTTWLGGDPTFGSQRTFTGFIDEAAVFNHALSQGQIVALFAKGIGATAIAPAIGNEPVSQTLFAGQVATWAVVGGGSTPLTYQWQAGVTGSGVFTNLSDGGAVSGSSSSTLTVYPVTGATAADYRMLLSNSAGSVTSSVATLSVLPIPAGQWVVNFQVTNNINGSPGLYNGPGVLWNGTLAPRGTWNPIADTLGQFVPGTFSSTSDLQDNGTVHSGITATVINNGGGYSGGGGGANNTLLSTYILVRTNAATLELGGVPPGIYNLCLYGVDGTYHDRGIIFTVDGMTNDLVNTQDTYFSPGDNTAIFQNVPILSGTVNVSMAADPTVHPPDFDEGDFNAVQIQLVTPAPVLTNRWNGSTLTLSWPAGSILLESTSVTGPWTTNNASSPLIVAPTLPKKFYRLQMPY